MYRAVHVIGAQSPGCRLGDRGCLLETGTENRIAPLTPGGSPKIPRRRLIRSIAGGLAPERVSQVGCRIVYNATVEGGKAVAVIADEIADSGPFLGAV